MSFMSDVKEAVIRELIWPDRPNALWSDINDEDWRRISIGVIKAGGAIVPRAQVRMLGAILRVLEDSYLQANHRRASSGDLATYQHFVAAEAQVILIMMQIREIVRG
jgi:hypothetical protein